MSGGIDGEHEPFTGEQDEAGEGESIQGADANLETPTDQVPNHFQCFVG